MYMIVSNHKELINNLMTFVYRFNEKKHLLDIVKMYHLKWVKLAKKDATYKMFFYGGLVCYSIVR